MANKRTFNKYDKWVDTFSITINLAPNIPIEVAKITPEKRMAAIIQSEPTLFMKLKDDAGNELPANAKVILAVKDKGEDLPMQITPAQMYRIWRDIDFAEQKSEKYIHNFVVDLQADILLEEGESLLIVVISPSSVTLSWDNSDFELPGYELNMDEVAQAGYEDYGFEDVDTEAFGIPENDEI